MNLDDRPAPQIIVPVWNGRDLLAKLLDSVARQTLPRAETLVIDNGSTDGAPELARERGARVIAMGRNAGFAAAVNRGIGEGTAEWLVILNSDVELEPDWLERLFLARPRWFATGKLMSVKSNGRLDGSWDVISRAACPWRAGEGRAPHAMFDREREIAAAPFTALLARAELFDRIGKLDERFESYLEDVDFGLRCAAAHFAGTYVPGAVAHHHGSASLGRWHPETTRRLARNQVFLIAKHYPRELIRRWWWPILMGQALWGLVALRHGNGRAWAHGKWQGLRVFGSFTGAAAISTENIVAASERELLGLQRATGFDFYWRLYFALVGQSDTGSGHE